jgi:mannose-1-phosphate guanylyltransferase/mannose-6-phosphate isomerase
LTPPDDNGNRLHGQAVALSSHNTYIRAQSRLVVALGTQDLIVVESPDAVLVAASHMAQQVRQVEPHLRQLKEGDDIASAKVMRPWGWFQELHQSEGCRIKLLHIEPGASLSLQSHIHRSEHWYVKSGVAQVICGNTVQQLTEKESIFIDQKQLHQLTNPGPEQLQVIEIQTGSYLEEDDIVRYESPLSDTHQRGKT